MTSPPFASLRAAARLSSEDRVLQEVRGGRAPLGVQRQQRRQHQAQWTNAAARVEGQPAGSILGRGPGQVG